MVASFALTRLLIAPVHVAVVTEVSTDAAATTRMRVAVIAMVEVMVVDVGDMVGVGTVVDTVCHLIYYLTIISLTINRWRWPQVRRRWWRR